MEHTRLKHKRILINPCLGNKGLKCSRIVTRRHRARTQLKLGPLNERYSEWPPWSALILGFSLQCTCFFGFGHEICDQGWLSSSGQITLPSCKPHYCSLAHSHSLNLTQLFIVKLTKHGRDQLAWLRKQRQEGCLLRNRITRPPRLQSNERQTQQLPDISEH